MGWEGGGCHAVPRHATPCHAMPHQLCPQGWRPTFSSLLRLPSSAHPTSSPRWKAPTGALFFPCPLSSGFPRGGIKHTCGPPTRWLVLGGRKGSQGAEMDGVRTSVRVQWCTGQDDAACPAVQGVEERRCSAGRWLVRASQRHPPCLCCTWLHNCGGECWFRDLLLECWGAPPAKACCPMLWVMQDGEQRPMATGLGHCYPHCLLYLGTKCQGLPLLPFV